MLRDLSFWMMNPRLRNAVRGTAAISAVMVLAVGCKVGPDYIAPPTPKVQSDWNEKTLENEQPQAGQEARLHNELPALDDWWSVFHDETMNLLLKTVNEQNLDIKVAAQRIYQAEMDYRYTRGELFPAIGTGASFSRTMSPGVGTAKHTYHSAWTWDLAASWELDVFGQIRRYIESYDAAWQATIEDLNNTKMLLLAETARTYINARLFEEEERIVRADIQSLETYLEKIQIRAEAGADCKVELVQAQAHLATVKASLPTIQKNYEECINRLSSLMGASPATVRELLTRGNNEIPNAPDALAVGIPADILRRRPDIRGLERRLAQQTALIGATEAELYPKFYIDGSFGLQAEHLDDLFTSRSITASIMPRLQWRIFEFGRVRCSIAKQESVTEAMRLEYQQAVLEASEEVNNAITGYVKLQNQYEEQVDSVKNYDEALKLSLDLYDAGKREYMVVLDSQRNLLSNRRSLAQIHAQLASSVVTLYTALGGGWQTDPQALSSLSGDYLRGDYVSPSQIQLSVPGEGVNQQGTLSQRAVPAQIQESSKPHGGYSYELPPEGKSRTRQNNRRTTDALQPNNAAPADTIPALPPVDVEDDLSAFPIPSTQPSKPAQNPRRSVLKGT
ncbi:MAG: efflux transporter outer membrane subunit [Planctomycetia bacterium]|nr:efflux transporter outer membrane subunit [Planctomycetia bacterium]